MALQRPRTAVAGVRLVRRLGSTRESQDWNSRGHYKFKMSVLGRAKGLQGLEEGAAVGQD